MKDVLARLFEVVPDAMILVDEHGRILLANQRAVQLFGHGPDSLVGAAVEDLVPAAVRHRHRGHRAGYMQQPRLRPMGASGMSLVGRRSDGSAFPVEIALSPVDLGDGRHVLATIRDVSETQRARQALARAAYDRLLARVGELAIASSTEEPVLDHLRDELAAVLQADAIAVLLAGDDGRPELRRSSGLDEHLEIEVPWSLDPLNPLGRAWVTGEPLLVPDFPAATSPRPAQALVDAGFRSSAIVPLHEREQPMGALVALSRQPGFFDHESLHCLVQVGNLLTAQVQRRKAVEQLAHAQRLESIGQLTGGIAHDFNNLLTVISGNLQLLELGCADQPAALELVEAALRGVASGATLTSKLLTFARRQHLRPQPLDPAAVLDGLAPMLRRTLGESVTVRIALEGEPRPIAADPALLESALLNLSINARDAMPRGGQLTISVGERRIGDGGARLEVLPGDYVVFSVADTGLGMAPEVLARVFEPFFTTKGPGRGSGLGLSMVYGFARQSGGGVQVASQLGYGTRIDLYLPVCTEPAETPARPPAAAPRGGTQRVLLVEDDPAVRHIARAFLVSLGYAVEVAAHAGEALERLEGGLRVDALFSDISLGAGLNGVELARAVRVRRPGLPVLLTSGDEHAIEDTHGPSGFALLRKPYRREQLAQALREQLAGRPAATG